MYIAHGTIVRIEQPGNEQLGNVVGKMNYALKRGVWFLREDWRKNTGTTGQDWLKQISNLR